MRRNSTASNKKGFTLIEVIVTLVVAAILAALFVTLMGKNLTGSPVSAVRAQNHYALIGVVEEMIIDYNQLMNAGNADVLGTLRTHIQLGNVGGNVPYFGQYTQVTGFITFNAATHIEQASAIATNTLKVTISRADQTITTLFTI
jgi:prepilin-type N-terminal cleavage/methylation domain-containing protein